MTLFKAIFENDAKSPAIMFDHRSINYGELRTLTVAMAKAISSLGIATGDRVAILLNDSPEFIETFISTFSLGAIAVPINMGLTVDEQRAILNDCTATLAIIEPELCNTLLTGAPKTMHFPERLLLADRETPDQLANVGQGFDVTKQVCSEPRTIIDRLSSLLKETENLASPVFPEPRQDQPAFLLYTSGSTGEPKGAVHRESDVFYTNQTFCQEVLKLKSDDRLFSSSRLPFAYGLGNSFSFPLLNGATTILCREKPTPEVIYRILAEYRPTIFFGVPVVYNLLLEHHRFNPLDCSSLRLCVSAGEALPAQLGRDWQRAFGVPVLDGIGSTEMLHMFMSNHAGDVTYGSSGKLLKAYEARLLDESGKPTPAGSEGNLWVKGDSAALGYWQRPQETARTFVDGWVRTGDLYRCDSNGYWFHMGRSDDCFKSSGQWVSPVEVEGVLLRHERVSRVAVVEDFDDNGLPCACAFVVSRDVESDSRELERGLQKLTSESLPRFKRPRRYVFVKDLPYTATGKVQRFKLRQRLKGQRDKASGT